MRGWAINEIPDAQKRGSSSAPGIWPRNSGENSPNTVEQWTPHFSKTRPEIIDITAAAARMAVVVGALPGRADESAGREPLIPGGVSGLVLQRFEGRADPVAEFLEPGSG